MRLLRKRDDDSDGDALFFAVGSATKSATSSAAKPATSSAGKPATEFAQSMTSYYHSRLFFVWRRPTVQVDE